MRIEKEQAIELRKQGMSYSQIKAALGISKSTLFHWIKDIPLTDEQKKSNIKNHNNGAKIGVKIKEYWRTKRQAIQDVYDPPLNDTEFAIGLALYWGEGDKYSTSEVAMTNTDVCILKRFVSWIKKYFDHHTFGMRIQHHNLERDQEIKEYWATTLNIPITSFIKSGILPKGSYRKNKWENGVARVQLIGQSRWQIRQKIEKALNELKRLS